MITADEWAGSFGDEYTDRQSLNTAGRGKFWNHLIATYEIRSALEIGCGAGVNLNQMRIHDKTGVDVNYSALEQVYGADTHLAEATDLPFPANDFDLVFTFGVLIHIPPEDLDTAMREIVRVSKRYVFCGEYLGDDEVPYRGGVLWRRDYGSLYQDIGLELVDQGILEGEPWDRNEIHWWLLEQKGGQ